MNTDVLGFLSAAVSMKKQPLTMAVFDAIANEPGIAGYAIARTLGQNPSLVVDALSSLPDMRLVSEIADLRDNFALTQKGYAAKELIAACPDIEWQLLVKNEGSPPRQ
jgi:Mn-dependent DtxR family transcriptional regulator